MDERKIKLWKVTERYHCATVTLIVISLIKKLENKHWLDWIYTSLNNKHETNKPKTGQLPPISLNLYLKMQMKDFGRSKHLIGPGPW